MELEEKGKVNEWSDGEMDQIVATNLEMSLYNRTRTRENLVTSSDNL